MMKIDLTDKEAEFLMRALVDNYAEDVQDFDPNDIRDRGVADRLISKLIGASCSGGPNLHETFTKACHDQYSAKQPLNEKLFLGSGNRSCVMKNKLHKRFEFAVSQLGGMQQNGGMGTEFDEEWQKEAEQDIRDVLKDFLIAFDLCPVQR